MTHSPLTDQIRQSSQRSSREGNRVQYMLWHHTASVSGHGDGVVAMMVNATRRVSSNYVFGSDGWLWNVVDEDFRAWTSGSTTDGGKGALFDRKSITSECCNSTGAPSWLQSDAFYAKAAALAVDVYRRYGVPLDRDHHLGHRELYIRFRASYPTACPGGMDIDRILAQARALLDPNAPDPTAAAKARVRSIGTYLNTLDMPPRFGLSNFDTGAAKDGIPVDPGETYSRYYHLVQMWGRLFRPDIYTAANDIDGITGPNTRKIENIIGDLVAAGTQPKTLPASGGGSATPPPKTPTKPPTSKGGLTAADVKGYTYKSVKGDGLTYQEPTGAFAVRMMRGLRPYDYSGPLDGVPGPLTRRAIQRAARKGGYKGVIDGVIGANTIKGVQNVARAGGYEGPIDGIPGPYTWTGFIKALGQ